MYVVTITEKHFVKIVELYQRSSDLYFQAQVFENIGFNSYHSFHVTNMNETNVIINVKNVPKLPVCDKRKHSNDSNTMRCLIFFYFYILFNYIYY